MKAIVTEAESTTMPLGVALLRDKRDGQVVMRMENGDYVTLTFATGIISDGCTIGRVFSGKYEWNTTEHLEPFNGSVTLSNE